MLVRKLKECTEIIAGQCTKLRELLHPDKQPIDLRYSLAHAIVPVGETTLPQALTTSEVYYIISGQGEMFINEESQMIEPGDAVYIPPHAKQYLRNTSEEPIVFVCIVDPAWRVENTIVY